MLKNNGSALPDNAQTSEGSNALRERAKTSRAAAVKLFCLNCVGGVRADVRDCTSHGCALYGFRPYRKT
jgi:hypothetical protein